MLFDINKFLCEAINILNKNIVLQYQDRLSKAKDIIIKDLKHNGKAIVHCFTYISELIAETKENRLKGSYLLVNNIGCILEEYKICFNKIGSILSNVSYETRILAETALATQIIVFHRQGIALNVASALLYNIQQRFDINNIVQLQTYLIDCFYNGFNMLVECSENANYETPTFKSSKKELLTSLEINNFENIQ